MRGQQHVRRAGMVSAGTLALALTSAASPAAADDGGEQRCRSGDGLLSTVTGVVCDTTDAVTTTATGALDDATGGATKDLSEEVNKVTDGVNDTLEGPLRRDERGDSGGSADPPSAHDPDGSSDEGSGSGGPGGPGDGGSGDRNGHGSDADGQGGDDAPRRDALHAAGFPAGAPGTSPLLQPLSPLAGFDLGRSPDTAAAAPEPKLPKIAPSPSPTPAPTPEGTRYVAPAGEQQSFDRGEATPALMVIFAIIAAGVVTGGHVAVAKARVRSRRVD